MPWANLSRSVAAVVAGAVVTGFAVGSPPAAPAAVPSQPVGAPPASQAGQVLGTRPAPHPVEVRVTEHRIPVATAASFGRGAAAGRVTLSPVWPVSGYATVGVTWAGSPDLGRTTLHVRTRHDGDWSSWYLLNAEEEHGADPGTVEASTTRPGTDPLLLGDVDSVQVKVVAPDGAAPRGLKLATVDPGTSSADAQPGTPTLAAPAASLAAGTGSVPRPQIFSRAQWGADERLRSGTPSFGSVQTTFVHHTVNANDYAAEDVPAILRSIYAYHTQSRGWSDIGYNVLVDRFGRLWEGRYGGLERNAIGAHTLNYNEEAFGVSAIGNFEVVEPSAKMVDALASVLAWKLDKAGLKATGSTQVQGVTFQMINGHRDAASTACPGGDLYQSLPAVRTKAAALIARGAPEPKPEPDPEPEPVAPSIGRAANADKRPDVVVREQGALRTLLGDAGPGFLRPVGEGTKAGRLETVTGVGDLDGDDRGDVLVRYRRGGDFEIRSGEGDGGRDAVINEGGDRFATATSLVGANDLTGDEYADLIVRLPTGQVKVAPGQEGGFAKARTVSTDWAAHRAVLGAGDLDGDKIGDLLLIDAQGVLWSVRGLGDLAYAAPVRVSAGWDGRTHIVAGRDLTGDGRPDLMFTDVADGLTWIRPGTTTGGLGVPIGGWPGWSTARKVAITSDATGDGFADVVLVNADGRMTVRGSRHGMWLRPAGATAGDWESYRWLRLVGDWNGDGKGDLAGVEGDLLWIVLGRGNGTFGERIGGWSGWAERSHLAAVDDWNRDGKPDLVSRDRSGSMWLHRGRSDNGVAEPVLLRPADDDLGPVLPVGRWDDDRRPDLVALLPGGLLQLWPGAGKASLGAPVNLTSEVGLRRFDRIMGVGDLTGDGHADLLATTRRAGTAFILPGKDAGIGNPIRVAGGWRQYTMIA